MLFNPPAIAKKILMAMVKIRGNITFVERAISLITWAIKSSFQLVYLDITKANYKVRALDLQSQHNTCNLASINNYLRNKTKTKNKKTYLEETRTERKVLRI